MPIVTIFAQSNILIMKVSVIGAGNMGGAVARGLVNSGKVPAEDITLTAGHKESLESYAPQGFVLTTDNASAVSGADVVMIAVKPAAVFSVVDEAVQSLADGSVVVCIAAGIDPDEFIGHLDAAGKAAVDLVYVIPNTAVENGSGVSFVTPVRDNHNSAGKVAELFGAMGLVKVVDMEGLVAGMVLSSCGIAYAMKYIQSCIEVGCSLGFSAEEARKIVISTVGGAAGLLGYRDSSPETEIRRVATPGGHTEKGLNRMDAEGFTEIIKAAMLDSE